MAKIGVVTFSNTSDNYGQVLQYLSTQIYLESRGHQAFLYAIECKKKSVLKRGIQKIINNIKRRNSIKKNHEEKQKELIFKKWSSIVSEMEMKHPRRFQEFRDKYFNYLNNLKHIEVFCAGSDQIWAGPNIEFFLAGIPKRCKRISIAPSIGHKVFSIEEIEIIRPWIHKFNFITTREESGIKLCEQAGYNCAVQILDPTFLIHSNKYKQFEDSTLVTEKPYLLVYLLGAEISICIQKIFDFAKENGLQVKYIASQGRSDEYMKIYPTVGQWLALIKNASCIITNSFHGMAFSIIYRKKFMVIPIIGIMANMNERINTLAHLMSLEGRIYYNNLNNIFNEIDYTIVEAKINSNINVLNTLMTTVDL